MIIGDRNPVLEPVTSQTIAVEMIPLGFFLESDHGEQLIQQALSQFQCSRNCDVQSFLHQTAIPYEKEHKSRTYLFANADSLAEEGRVPEILAFISISLKYIEIDKSLSGNLRRRLHGRYTAAGILGYLIGQLGRDDAYDGTNITGDQLIAHALSILEETHTAVGGRFILVECEPIEPLLAMYTRNGFQRDLLGPSSKLTRCIRML